MRNPCSGFKAKTGTGFAMSGKIGGGAENLLKARFSRLDFRMKDMKPVFKGLIDTFRKEISMQFNTEGAHGGHPWQQLASSTVLDRISKGFPGEHPILQRTGRLRDSLTEENHIDACGGITARGFVIGTQVPYAKYHQSSRPRKKLPRRAFMFITNQFRLTIVRAIHRFVVKGTIT